MLWWRCNWNISKNNYEMYLWFLLFFHFFNFLNLMWNFWRFTRPTYSEGKKPRNFLFCSNFMSFTPINFIFIGWIGYKVYFFWVLRNFDFKPANEIFSEKCKLPISQKTCFLGVWPRKLSLSKIGVMDMSYIMDFADFWLYTTFPNFFLLISADSADLSKK